ncbi:translocon-associated protein subunit gamma-like [Histomonas meleagridis]|uniref:translocon-associated protein subunit gamma-like n=1 Tax=Histomonas meleagridis TaxID=135588 RepID=UPI0035596445|nr:translocon-associated protein subunit gamma-like [Histomonas meleagridis]KAH0800074.1 translocon-associated protein subunit gamma-like [Histomonas meleagridis]
MPRKQSPGANRNTEDQDELYNELRSKRQPRGFSKSLKFLPFGLIFSLIGVILYVAVGGVDIKEQIVYIIVAYAIGVVGLTVAYAQVAEWVTKQRSVQMKSKKTAQVQVKASEGVFFTLFYNNAFYCFLLLIGSHLIFSNFQPAASMILSQVCASFIPAWISSFSK